MVNITHGATDGVEQSVEKLVRSNDTSSTDRSPQSGRTTMTTNLDQFHQ